MTGQGMTVTQLETIADTAIRRLHADPHVKMSPQARARYAHKLWAIADAAEQGELTDRLAASVRQLHRLASDHHYISQGYRRGCEC